MCLPPCRAETSPVSGDKPGERWQAPPCFAFLPYETAVQKPAAATGRGNSPGLHPHLTADLSASTVNKFGIFPPKRAWAE